MQSIRKKMLLYFGILIVAVVWVTGMFICWRATDIVQRYTSEAVYNGLSMLHVNIDNMLLAGQDIYLALVANRNLNGLLARKIDLDDRIDFYDVQQFLSQMRTLALSYEQVDSIYIYDINDGILYTSSKTALALSGYETSYVYQQAVKMEKFGVWMPNHPVEDSRWVVNEDLVTVAYPIMRLAAQERIGYIFINIPRKSFLTYLEGIQYADAQKVCIGNIPGEYIVEVGKESSTPLLESGILDQIYAQKEPLGDFVLKDGSRLYFEYSQESGMYYFLTIPHDVFSRERRAIVLFTVMVCLGVLTLACLIAANISNQFHQPIRRLVEIMERFKVDASVPASIDERREDEFGLLYRSFNAMARDNIHLTRSLVDEQRQRRMTEIQLLQEQINPHFLYNTLNSINCQAKLQGAREIAALATTLVNFFRISLSGGNKMISVRTMLDQLTYYIQIENACYQGHYMLATQVQPQTLNCRVPKLLLQPLVENAVVHGLRNIPNPPPIQVRIEQQEGKLLLSVRDMGVGVDAKRLARMNNALRDGHGCFAIHNLHARLKAYYQEDYELYFEGSLGKGVCAHITLGEVHRREEVDV